MPIKQFFWRLLVIFLLTIGSSQASFAETNQLSPQSERTLRFASSFRPKSLDPLYATSEAENRIIIDIFEGLLFKDINRKLQFGVADEYHYNETRDKVYFHLRNDAKWSNGDPVTAYDFEFALTRFFMDEYNSFSKATYLIKYLKNAADILEGKRPLSDLGVHALDDQNLLLELEAPIPFLEDIITNPTFSPVPKKLVQQYGPDWFEKSGHVSNGTFTFSEIDKNEVYIFKRNPNYYQADKVYWETVERVYLDDARKSMRFFHHGLIDSFFEYLLPPDNWQNDNLSRHISLSPADRTDYLSFNTKKYPMDNPKIRLAMQLALERKDLAVRVGAQVNSEPAYAFSTDIPEKNWYPNQLLIDKKNHNERLAEAQALMKSLGYNENNPLEIELICSYRRERVTNALKALYAPIYINLTVTNEDQRQVYQIMDSGDFEVGLISWAGDFSDPISYLEILTSSSSKNRGKWHNDLYDQLFTETMTMPQSDLRNQKLLQMERIIQEENPIIPIERPLTINYFGERIKNWPTKWLYHKPRSAEIEPVK